MWSGGKEKERRECILNSTPLESFCFLYFIFRKIRGEERREFILNSTPPSNLLLFFVFLYSKNQRSRDETVFV